MKRKLLFLVTTLMSLLGMQSALAQYSVSDLTAAGWTKVTSISQEEVGNNYYVITDANESYMLGLADSEAQGNKAVFYQTPVDPDTDMNKMWYLEANGSDFAMRNAEYSYLQLQTEWEGGAEDNNLKWRTNDQPRSTAAAAVSWSRMSLTYSDGSWLITSIQYSRPLGIYNDAEDEILETPSAGSEIGANDVAYAQRFQIYAISKLVYNSRKAQGATADSPTDLTQLVKNTDFNVTSGRDGGWYVSNKTGGNYNFNGAVEAWHYGDYDLNQALQMPNGLYKATVQANATGTSAKLYVNGDESTISEALTGNFADMHNAIDADETAGRVEVSSTVTDNNLTLGLKDPDNGSAWIVFDNFKLYYYGQTIKNVAQEFTNGAEMTADQWYYFDVDSENTFKVEAGSDLTSVVYTTDGNTLLENQDDVTTQFTATDNQFGVTRIYFKSNTAQTLRFSGFLVKNGTYYLYNEYTGRFLGKGADWGTHAVTDIYGVPLNISTDDDGYSLLKFVDNNLYLGDQYWLYTDCDNERITKFQIVESTVDGYSGFQFATTKFENAVADKKFLYVYVRAGNDQYKCAGNSTEGENIESWAQTVWKVMSKEEHDAIFATYPTQNIQNVIEASGINTTAEKFDTYMNNLYTPTTLQDTYLFEASDYTSVRGQDNQPVYNTENKWIESFQATGSWTKTITGLTEGIYKVSFNGYERRANNATSYELGENGWDCTSTYLTANGEQVRFSSWYENAELNESVYKPDNTTEGLEKFGDGNYLNEVYAYVGSDGNLTLTVNKPGFVDACWVFFNDIKLTRYDYNEPIAGTYYLKNEGTGQFLSFEGNWGTYYSLSDVGEPLTFATDQEGYNTLQTTNQNQNNYMYSNNSNSGYAFSDGNNTGGGERWSLSEVETGIYTIKNVETGKYVSAQYDDLGGLMLESTTTTTGEGEDAVTETNRNTYWKLYTKNELIAQVATTAGTPVDASIFISEPDLNRAHNPYYYDGSEDWKVFGFDGLNATGQGILALAGVNGTNNYSYAYLVNNDFFNALQTVKGLPNGVYVVSCQGAFRDGWYDVNNDNIENGKYVNRAYLYANTNTAVDTQSENYVDKYSTPNNNFTDVYDGAQLMPLKIAEQNLERWNADTHVDVAKAFRNKEYTTQIPVIVENGQLTIGVVQEIGINGNLVAFDNFRLTYYGTGEEALEAAYNVAKDNLQDISDNMFDKETTGVQEKTQITAALADTRTDYAQAIADYNRYAKEFGESSISRHIYDGLVIDRTNGLYTQEKYPWAGNAAFNDMEQYYNGSVDATASLENLRKAITATRMFIQANAEARKIEEELNLTGTAADEHREVRKAIVYGTSPITFAYGDDEQFANIQVTLDTHGGGQTFKNQHSWMPREAYGNRYFDYWNYYGNQLNADYHMTITGLPAGKYMFTIAVSQGNMESIKFTETSTLDGNVVNNVSREIFDSTQPQWGIYTHNWQDIWCTANITNTSETVDLSFLGTTSLNAGTVNFTNLRIYRIQDADELLLDEDAEYLSKKLDYVDAKLVLRRSLNKDKWNTLVLPVNLTADQVKSTFGEGVQVAKADYVYSSGNSEKQYEFIHFSTQDDVEIDAGQFYLIKPTVEPGLTSDKEYAYVNTEETEGGISRSKTLTGCPIWFVDGVDYTRAENEDGTVDNTHGNPESSASLSDEGHELDDLTTTPIQLHGFYSVGKFTVGDKYIYAFKNNGELQMLKRGTSTERTMKGFRWYIEDVTGELTKSLGFAIDGEEFGDATEIGLIQADENVVDFDKADIYDLQGRKVNTKLFKEGNSPKGVYIVNGKKVLLK